MEAVAGNQPMSVADYLEREAGAEARHEYINGSVYAMAGASERHNIIAGWNDEREPRRRRLAAK